MLSLDKKAKIKPKGQTFFQGQTRNKKAKIELFGLKKAKLRTLVVLGKLEVLYIHDWRHRNSVILHGLAIDCKAGNFSCRHRLHRLVLFE